MDNFTEYVDTVARMSILKAKAAFTCPVHPDVMIRNDNDGNQQRAFMIAQNTLVYNDKIVLLKRVTSAVEHELKSANANCLLCNLK
ncbi:hypothetical protein L0657_22340 [Dyadobacter sp. CY345]|uniref:hypothetical protein n=1 Tax=Dyadobacter sp. CY345 TaxID=2909335 RepID=UPI001F2093D2|nr:hypothetical protein [Dyadobacter sp. CY345]MCF2446714.1 hypothetical protein [Dyadobacter sp. CY345]